MNKSIKVNAIDLHNVCSVLDTIRVGMNKSGQNDSRKKMLESLDRVFDQKLLTRVAEAATSIYAVLQNHLSQDELKEMSGSVIEYQPSHIVALVIRRIWVTAYLVRWNYFRPRK